MNVQGYVGIMQVGGLFAPCYVQGQTGGLLSLQPTSEAAARAAAQVFAQQRNIPYKEALFKMDKPIITVYCEGGQGAGPSWLPAELHSNGVDLAADYAPPAESLSQEQAAIDARQIAEQRGLTFHPEIGVFLCTKPNA